jgi:hypothetical protein
MTSCGSEVILRLRGLFLITGKQIYKLIRSHKDNSLKKIEQ